MMQWFGKHWGAPMCDECQQVPTPVGQHCGWCEEIIVEGDNGVILNNGTVPFHYECHIRGIVGSVGHQMHRCSCYGQYDASEDGLSLRQAAQQAVACHAALELLGRRYKRRAYLN